MREGEQFLRPDQSQAMDKVQWDRYIQLVHDPIDDFLSPLRTRLHNTPGSQYLCTTIADWILDGEPE